MVANYSLEGQLVTSSSELNSNDFQILAPADKNLIVVKSKLKVGVFCSKTTRLVTSLFKDESVLCIWLQNGKVRSKSYFRIQLRRNDCAKHFWISICTYKSKFLLSSKIITGITFWIRRFSAWIRRRNRLRAFPVWLRVGVDPRVCQVRRAGEEDEATVVCSSPLECLFRENTGKYVQELSWKFILITPNH